MATSLSTYGPPSNTIPTAHPSPQPKRHPYRFSRLRTDDRRVSLIIFFTMGRPCSPKNLPLPMGGSGPPSNTWFLGPPKSSTQTAARSVQPFLQGSLVWQTDRPTDHATRSARIGRIYVRSTAMRPNKYYKLYLLQHLSYFILHVRTALLLRYFINFTCVLPLLKLRLTTFFIKRVRWHWWHWCRGQWTASVFGATVYVKRFALSYRTVVSLCPVCPRPVLSVCNVGVLWPNGWMDQDETWHAGRPGPWPHCVRWGPSSPPQRGLSPSFRPMSTVTKRSPILATAEHLCHIIHTHGTL